MQGSLRGYTLIEIMVVVSIFAVLAAISFPSYLHARAESWKKSCISNLRQIQGAVEQAMLMQNGTVEYNSLFGASGYIRAKPICPVSQADYTLEGSTPKCSVEDHTLPQ